MPPLCSVSPEVDREYAIRAFEAEERAREAAEAKVGRCLILLRELDESADPKLRELTHRLRAALTGIQ